MSDFYSVIDLEKLADKLEGMGFVREGKPERGRADRQAADDWPQNGPESDPWSNDEPRQERGSRSSSARSSRSSDRSRSSQRSSSTRGGRGGSDEFPSSGTERDRFDNDWTFGEPDAPECEHGHTAALKEGVSQQGKDYRAWVCPLGLKAYKRKCDFFEYVKD